MNKQSASMFVVTCILLLVAVIPVPAQSAPGLEVSDFDVRYIPQWNSRRGAASNPMESDLSGRPARFELSAVFRNTGEKVINSIDWECLFFKNEQQTEVMLRHKYRDGKRLLPGEKLRMKHDSLKGAATKYKAVRLMRVVYDDGTVWRATKGASEIRN